MRIIRSGLEQWSRGLHARSVQVIAACERNFFNIMLIWVILACTAIGFRVAGGNALGGWSDRLQMLMHYLPVVASPIAAWFLADRLFPRGALLEQPQIRLARVGRWRAVDCLSARQHPLFGPTGIMASLAIGILINVLVRSAEFLTAVPAMSAIAPLWGQVLFASMLGDVVVMNFLYVTAFVMAIRAAPWFPRMMLLVWMTDICSQIVIAHVMSATSDLPPQVGHALATLLEGNVKKVMISMIIWLPYLLLSDRVNLTYRSRIALA